MIAYLWFDNAKLKYSGEKRLNILSKQFLYEILFAIHVCLTPTDE